tara:strand:- start:174 stop:851 length:678 start_codon:yes stop_codon:yes gene_type:complete
MLQNKDRIWLIYLPQICLCVFLFLQIIAMLLYSGGTLFNPETLQYSFIRNFLSDLGRSEGFSGNNNFLSSQLFNTSLMLAGFVFITFYYKLTIIFVKYNYFLAKLGSFFGIMGGLSLMAVGLTPANLYLSSHIIAAHWLFRFFFLAAIIFSYLTTKSKLIHSKYARGYIVFAILILIYIIISEFGPSPKSNEIALTIQVVSQKCILIIMLFSVYWQTKGISIISK